jgi:hypothetical protein
VPGAGVVDTEPPYPLHPAISIQAAMRAGNTR